MSYETVYQLAAKKNIGGVRRLLAAGRPVDEPNPEWLRWIVVYKFHVAIMVKLVTKNNASAVQEINKDIRNKFCWAWLDKEVTLTVRSRKEDEVVTEKLSDFIGKCEVFGKAQCLYCNDLINYGSRFNWTALHYVARYGYTDIPEVLILADANVNATDDSQHTPLHLAAQNGQTATVDLLLKSSANVNAVDYGQLTPLHYAAMIGQTATVDLLLKSSAIVNAVDYDHYTPLHLAACYGYPPIVEKLLHTGANVNAVNKVSVLSIQV
uniref:Ankyrin repeat and protein kinase domain-containing protein 1-like n=1 Tax=Saccoglossus kowalevskii TaxID=10224 RepID=A0ABM0LVT6_SACKO|nr:PREDICTED: ankyrin repeat and protein kinase domain-containing protein 1-like [Saccoglossus kowalevskii]